MKSFRLLFPKAGIALFVFMFAIFSSASIFGAATITNIVITPASPIPGQAITIDFDISVTNGQRPRFAIALSDKTTLNFCGQDWIASKKGIYKNQTTWWYDGVAKVSTGVAITDTNGPDNNESLDPGVNGDGTLKHVKVISAIPPEKSGNMYIIIIARGGDALNGPRYQCSAFNSSGIDTIAVSAMFTVTGTTTPYKLNLEMLNSGVCLGTNTGSKWNQNYKITNWSESGIFLSNLKIRYWINDTHAWTFNNHEDRGYSPAGAQVPNDNINTAEQNDTFNNAITASCESGTRIANKYFEFGWNAAAGTYPYVMIAPNGGYVTKIQAWELNVNAVWNSATSYWYTRPCDWGNTFSSSKYAGLYLLGNLICEYINATTTDPNTGEAPCSINGCISPTSTITPTATVSPTGVQNIAYYNYGSSNHVAFIMTTATPTWTSSFTPSVTMTNTYTYTFTMTPSSTVTQTSTSTATPTNTATQTSTPTDTPTNTSTSTFTYTSTNTSTYTVSVTNTQTNTSTATATPTSTATLTSTATPTNTSTQSSTSTNTPSNTSTSTFTYTSTNTSTYTVSVTNTQTNTSTSTDTPTDTATKTATSTETSSSTNTSTHTPTNTVTITNTKTSTATYTDTPTDTSTHTATSTDTPSNTFTATPTDTSTSTATSTNTPSNTSTATPTNTATATYTQTATASNTNTASPTSTSTATSTDTKTATFTATATDTYTQTSTFTSTPTSTFTATYTNTYTNTSTSTPSQTFTATATSTSTPTATFTGTNTSTYTSTNTATNSFTNTASPTATATATVTMTSSSTYTYTATATPTYTFTVTNTFTATPTSTSTSTFTDSPTITPTFTVTPTPIPFPYTVKIEVYNSAGEIVKLIGDIPISANLKDVITIFDGKETNTFNPNQGELQISLMGVLTRKDIIDGPDTNLYWDGTNNGLQPVSQGLYYIKLMTTNEYGQVETIVKEMNVLSAQEFVKLEIFNSSGELVRTIKSLNPVGSVINLAVSDVVSVGKGNDSIKVEYAPGQIIYWDGNNSGGRTVDSGVYEMRVEISTANGFVVMASKSVTILNAGKKGVISEEKVYPNPISNEAIHEGKVTIKWTPSGQGRMTVYIYTIEGVLVRKLDTALVPAAIDWNLQTISGQSVSNGMYILVLQAQRDTGEGQIKVLKLAIVRKY